MPSDKPARDPRHEFASKLAFLMNEAGRLGLWLTMNKIHDALKQCGWEMANQEVSKHATE